MLEDLDVTLPEINEVSAVPDCMDDTILQFYRWGILNGKDPYGSLHGSAALSRAAAAAMLARLIDPDQRLTFRPETLDLCRDMLNTDPETVPAVIGGQSLSAELTDSWAALDMEECAARLRQLPGYRLFQ